MLVSLIKFILVSALVFMSHSLEALWTEKQTKESMVEDLNWIRRSIELGYAPLDWKKSQIGLDLDLEFEKGRQLILESKGLTTKQFHQIIKSFLASLQDYHVSVVFCSTESASLPLSIKGVDGRYFVDAIDSKLLSPEHYTIQPGDEVLSLDGLPIKQWIDAIMPHVLGGSNPLTNQRIAESLLTDRRGCLGEDVPQGAAVIEFKSRMTGQPYGYQILWDYCPDYIYNPHDFIMNTGLFSKQEPDFKSSHMMSAAYEAMIEAGVSAKKSFIPPLGSITWLEMDKNSFWNAYIFLTPQGKKIGCFRISHYHGKEKNLKKLEEIIHLFEEETDALVIDQVNNGGGLIKYSFDLLSMLTNVPLATPQHRIKNTQREIFDACQNLKKLNQIQFLQKFDMAVENDYQEILFLKKFFSFNIDEWNAGRTLTDPTHLDGIDFINPHPHCRYSKPILMLINELDFSGGDFVPAILKDNKRAVLFGSRTGGAGGFVLSASFPNDNGILTFSYTGSIAERPGTHAMIEDIGVSPDIEYTITVDDLENGYERMAAAIVDAIENLTDQQKLNE